MLDAVLPVPVVEDRSLIVPAAQLPLVLGHVPVMLEVGGREGRASLSRAAT